MPQSSSKGAAQEITTKKAVTRSDIAPKKRKADHSEPITKKSQKTAKTADKDSDKENDDKKEKVDKAKKQEGKKATQNKKATKNKKEKEEEKDETKSNKPRLTTPDIEFDYDRSQLRDPRPTPGRNARPRYDEYDAPQEVKDWIDTTFEIPEPEKPIGRLTSYQKDEVFRNKCRLNPLDGFHGLYKCHDKGREGSPTYDSAGFQLDWVKVDRWMKPQPYNKKKMIRNMDKHLDEAEKKKKTIFDYFFVEGHHPDKNIALKVENIIKDVVSKDLGVLYHQIGPQHFKQWREQGHEPVKFEEWWKEPTEEDSKRIWKMIKGGSLRKDF